MFVERFKIFLDVGVDAQVDYLKARTFKHHGYKIFPDVMNVALDSP